MDGNRLLDDALVWDAHSCVPLHPDFPLTHLKRHLDAGANFVSINIGMDMNPLSQIMMVLAGFRAQIKANPALFMAADTVQDIVSAKAAGKLAVAFDLEGAMPLMGRVEMVPVFHQLGVRQIHLAYNRNNETGGGCYDEDVPLTGLGRKIVRAIHEAGILMDCSHTGHRTSLDIMAMDAGPVFFSHANPRSINPDLRNITDEQLQACVATGGVICANGVGRFLADPAAKSPALIAAIDALVEKAGIDHVGLGIDFEYDGMGLDDMPAGLDRTYWWPAEHGYGPDGVNDIKIAKPEQLSEIAHGLLDLGYDETGVRAILGGNMRRFAERVWKK